MTQAIRVVPPPTEREIRIGVDVARMTDEAIAALAEDPHVYQRASSLVHVVRTVEPPKLRGGKIRRAAGVPVIRALSKASLLERLSDCAHWIKWNGKNKVWEPVLPMRAACEAVHARGEWGGLRGLVGVTCAPTFRADGSILQTPGWDDKTGLLYWPSLPSFPSVPEEPTRDAARDAYRDLCSTVRFFPFASDVHRAAWACSVLTLLARPAIDGPCPLFAFDANTRGAGKSKLADAAFRIALGHNAARSSLPEEDEEMRKRITAIVLCGDQACLLDNVSAGQALGGRSLEAVLTGTSWTDRILGHTDMTTMPCLVVWFATGNNLEFTEDASRRSLLCRLESPLENPEEATFPEQPNLMQWIDDRRHHLVTWALTILRAWHVAGRPLSCKPWGSFPEWQEIIPNAVAWVADVDPTLCRVASSESGSEEKFSIGAVLECIAHLAGKEGALTAKQLVTALYSGHEPSDSSRAPDVHPSFGAAREVLEAGTRTKNGQVPQAMKVGHMLKRMRGRVVQHRKLVTGERVNNTVTWSVQEVV